MLKISTNASEPGASRATAAINTSTVRRTAEQLRTIIFSKPEGAYLGSQEELRVLLGVGRVTLQQVARLLEHDSLLAVSRGVNGGYYGRRPTVDMVERAVVTYLRSMDTRFSDQVDVGAAMSVVLVRRAIKSSNEDAWSRLRDFEEKMTAVREATDLEFLARWEGELFDIIFQLADSPFGELIMHVNARIFFSFDRGMVMSKESQWQYHNLRLKLTRSILDRDRDYAEILIERFACFIADELGAMARANAPQRSDREQAAAGPRSGNYLTKYIDEDDPLA